MTEPRKPNVFRDRDIVREGDLVREGDIVRDTEVVRDADVIGKGDVLRDRDVIRDVDVIREREVVRGPHVGRDRDIADVTSGDDRAQPGDVLGIERDGERTHLGETREDEDKRREDAEQSFVDERNDRRER